MAEQKRKVAVIAEKARCELDRRADYDTPHPPDSFIVLLLREHILRVLDTHAAPAPEEGRALDVGCGRQPFRRAIEDLGYSYFGLDVQQNREGTVHFVCPLDQPLPTDLSTSASFHFVLCTEVLEHVADWDMAFANLARLTATGGHLLITCPHIWHLHEEPFDFWRPTLYGLHFFANRHGFKTIEQQAAGDTWDVFGTLLGNSTVERFSTRLPDRIMANLTRRCHRWLFQALLQHRLQTKVHLRSKFYLSNIVVLERL